MCYAFLNNLYLSVFFVRAAAELVIPWIIHNKVIGRSISNSNASIYLFIYHSPQWSCSRCHLTLTYAGYDLIFNASLLGYVDLT